MQCLQAIEHPIVCVCMCMCVRAHVCVCVCVELNSVVSSTDTSHSREREREREREGGGGREEDRYLFQLHGWNPPRENCSRIPFSCLSVNHCRCTTSNVSAVPHVRRTCCQERSIASSTTNSSARAILTSSSTSRWTRPLVSPSSLELSHTLYIATSDEFGLE